MELDSHSNRPYHAAQGVTMRQLLLISCSQRKRDVLSAPAGELYDGPYYRIIRKLRREDAFPPDTDVLILSSRHGIIEEDRVISYYDQKMSMEQARQLLRVNLSVLGDIMTNNPYGEIMINLGKTYMASIKGYETLIPSSSHIEVCYGEIGMRMSQMRRWLLRV